MDLSSPTFGRCPFLRYCFSAANTSIYTLLWNPVDRSLQSVFLIGIWLFDRLLTENTTGEQEGQRKEKGLISSCWLCPNNRCNSSYFYSVTFWCSQNQLHYIPSNIPASNRYCHLLTGLNFKPSGSLSNFLGTNNSKRFPSSTQPQAGKYSYHYSLCLNAVPPFLLFDSLATI